MLTIVRMAQPTESQKLRFYQLQHNASQKYEITLNNLGNVALSNTSKDQALQLDDNYMAVKGSQGYRTVLATHGVQSGQYYYELKFNRAMPASQIRAGFAVQSCHLDGPVGFDKNCFAIRSVDCSICTERRRLRSKWEDVEITCFNQREIKDGDMLAFLINLPVTEPPFALPEETEMCYTRGAITIGRKKVETDDNEMSDVDIVEVQPKVLPDVKIPGSFIKFYINGELIAQVENINYQRYYPAISLYNFASCEVNFGRTNAKIPGYPPEFYCLPFTLAQKTGDYEVYGMGGCKQQFQQCEDKTPLSRQFLQFMQNQQPIKVLTKHVDVQEPENLGYKYYDAERMGPIREFRDLYLVRGARENLLVVESVKNGDFTVDLFKEIERFCGEGKKTVKKLKK